MEQGYAEEINSFISSWIDTLVMDYSINKEVKSKYYTTLATTKKILSYKFKNK